MTKFRKDKNHREGRWVNADRFGCKNLSPFKNDTFFALFFYRPMLAKLRSTASKRLEVLNSSKEQFVRLKNKWKKSVKIQYFEKWQIFASKFVRVDPPPLPMEGFNSVQNRPNSCATYCLNAWSQHAIAKYIKNVDFFSQDLQLLEL